MRSGARRRMLIAMRSGIDNRPPDATFANGRWELPPSARGVLVLADPPEAGWRLEPGADDLDGERGAVRSGCGDEGTPEQK